jgi:large subunit ribosomal protein L10
MALLKDKKAEVVEEVTQLLKDSRITVVAKYQGTSVKSMQELRKTSRDNGTKVMVVKNRLFKRAAAGDERFKDTDLSAINGQLMYAFNQEDEVAPAQSLAAFAKNEPQIEFVAALTTEGKLLPAEEVKVLASLPSKNELIAQTVAMLLSPVNDVTNALSGNLHALLDGVEAKAAA